MKRQDVVKDADWLTSRQKKHFIDFLLYHCHPNTTNSLQGSWETWQDEVELTEVDKVALGMMIDSMDWGSADKVAPYWVMWKLIKGC